VKGIAKSMQTLAETKKPNFVCNSIYSRLSDWATTFIRAQKGQEKFFLQGSSL
jgi:hypothetical protein